MKRSTPQQPLAWTSSDGLWVSGCLASMVDDSHCTVILVPQCEQPLEERSEFVALVFVSSTQNEVEWVKNHQHWPETLDFRLQHFPVLLDPQIKAEVVEEFEWQVYGEIQVHGDATETPLLSPADVDVVSGD